MFDSYAAELLVLEISVDIIQFHFAFTSTELFNFFQSVRFRKLY